MRVQRLHQIGKDREPPGQIGQGGIGGIAGIAVLLAPVLSGLVIFSDNNARGFHFLRINGRSAFGQGSAVQAGHKEGFDLGHGITFTAARRQNQSNFAKEVALQGTST